MTDEEKQDRQETYDQARPFIRMLVALVIFAKLPGNGDELPSNYYMAADSFLSPLEEDLRK